LQADPRTSTVDNARAARQNPRLSPSAFAREPAPFESFPLRRSILLSEIMVYPS